ncbi:acyltransferase family protein [Roseibium sp.]|uniref:acyltransferase family protein n=1 Tax=Roseibium sp. TaxID=1936156 RepID=UPI00329A56A8
MDYRREIDGLRAVAVLPVIFFHAGFEAFGGGFVGVDVFFVISGYLITSILIGDLKNGRFSLMRFYERRARRILPALFLVVVCCIPFALAWMSPAQIKDFGESVIAVVFFGSNILFWREDGYFGASVELKPLLHTWSLAVEEQFYLLFPLLLLALWKCAGRKALWVIALMSVASFVLCEWARLNGDISNSAVFYLAPTRAWELLAGSICAFALTARQAWRNDVLSVAGLLLILTSVFLFDEDTPFPSYYALLPVGGTVLVILFASHETLCARLLSLPIFVGVGLVSYSAYLWHQPLFAFARLRSLFDPSDLLMLGLSAASLGLAYLSWRFVETPLRVDKAPFFTTRTRLCVASSVVAASLAALGAIAIVSKDWLSIEPKAQFAELEQRTSANRGLSSTCNGFIKTESCSTSHTPEFLVWGDSYAMHITLGIVSSEPKIKIQQFTQSNCSPILLPKDRDLIETGVITKNCANFNSQVTTWLKDTPSVKYVVMSSTYAVPVSRSGNAHLLISETIDFVERLGKKVVIFSPTPSSGYNIGHCAIRSVLGNWDEGTCDFLFTNGGDKHASFTLLKKLSARTPIIWLNDMICPRSICDVIQDGNLIYRDKGHLSSEGSAFLGKTFNWADRVRSASSKK